MHRSLSVISRLTRVQPGPVRRSSTWLRRVGVLALCVSGVGLLGSFDAPPLAAQERPQVSVNQGEIGRWGGDAVRCGMDGKSWSAVEGVCYYPVDLQRGADVVEIARWREGSNIELAWLKVEAKEYELQEIDLEDESFVDLSQEDLSRHHQEQSQIKPVFRRRGGEARFTLPLGQPLSSPLEARFFGVRREFNGEPKSPHTGSDYAVGLGTPTLAVADGKVVLTGEHFFAGRSVYVQHGDGLVSMYFHLDSIDVSEGDEVSRGDTVGKVGSTGRSTGPHLHLGVRWHGARVNPALLLGDPQALPAVGSDGAP